MLNKLRTTRTALAAVGLAAGALVVLSACSSGSGNGSSSDGSSKGSKSATAVTLLESSPEGMGWAVELADQSKGYFADQGLDVTLQSSDGGTEAVQQLIAKKVDFAYSDAASIVVAATKDDSLRVLGCQNQSNVFSINVLDSSKVASVADLKGKTIGIVDEGSGEGPLVTAAIKKAGLDGQIKKLAVGSGPVAARALQQGQVDAYAGGLSDMVALKAAGLKLKNITPDAYAGLQSHCLTTRSDVLSSASGKKTATSLLTALVKGAGYLIKDEDGAYDAVCKAYAQACTNKDASRGYLDSVVDLTKPTASESAPWAINEDGWTATVDFLSLAKSVDASHVDLKSLTKDPTATGISKAASAG